MDQSENQSDNLIDDLSGNRIPIDYLFNPETVYVSGMPLLYRGYNGRYDRQLTSSNTVYYQRVEHKQYYGITIKDTKLIKSENGVWRLQQLDESGYKMMPWCKERFNNILSPVGQWTDGITVTTNQDWKTWKTSNITIVITGIFAVILMAIYYMK